MAPEFINLCDSSDDAAPRPSPARPHGRSHAAFARARSPSAAATDDPFDLPDDHGPLPPPRKRRRPNAANWSPRPPAVTPLLTAAIRSIAAAPASSIPEVISPHPPVGRPPPVARTSSPLVVARASSPLAIARVSKPPAVARTPIASTTARAGRAAIELPLSSDTPLDESESLSSPHANNGLGFSLSTTNLLAEISGTQRGPAADKRTKRGSRKASGGDATTKAPRATQQEKERKRSEKQAAQELKKAEKEAAKERKRAEKAQRDAEKQAEKQRATALTGANRARGSKAASAAEMIVDLPDSLEGKPLEAALREALTHAGIDAAVHHSFLPNVVRFRRRVRAAWNEERGHFEPAPERVQEERQILCWIAGPHFLAMASASDAQREGVDAYLQMVRLQYPDFKITCLIEGLDAAVKKGAKASRKAYNASVRGEAGAGDGVEAPGPSLDDQLSEALVALQVEHGCLVHQTDTAQETADFVARFTQYISTIPDKARLDGEATFCMDFGQVRTGDDDDDTFLKMLQQVTRVTESVAGGVVGQYPSVAALIAAFEKHGPMALEDLTASCIYLGAVRARADRAQKRHNANGSRSESRIGPALSRRLHNVFLGTDPEATDV